MCPGGVQGQVRAGAANSGKSRSLNEEMVTIARRNRRTTPDSSNSDNKWENWTTRNILYSVCSGLIAMDTLICILEGSQIILTIPLSLNLP